MNGLNAPNRRTVLKTISAGVVGGTVLAGSASGHGGDFRVPSWFENQVWEMTAKPPGHTPDESHAPIWHIAPGAKPSEGYDCAQIPGLLDFSNLEDGETFADGEWGCTKQGDHCVPGTGPHFDQTLSANPFSSIWHIHWVFDSDVDPPYAPDDLVNTGVNGVPLTTGERIREADSDGLVDVVHIPFAFNCPIRPAQGDEHVNYCD